MPLAHRKLRRTTRSNQALHAVGWCCQTPAATAALPVGALHGVKHKRVLHTGQGQSSRPSTPQLCAGLGFFRGGLASSGILPSHPATALGSVRSLHATSHRPQGCLPSACLLHAAQRFARGVRGEPVVGEHGIWRAVVKAAWTQHDQEAGVAWGAQVAWEAHAQAEYRAANTNNTALFTPTLAGHVSCTPHVPATQPAPPMLEQVDLHARHFRQLVVQRRKLAQHLLGDRRRRLACRGGQGR